MTHPVLDQEIKEVAQKMKWYEFIVLLGSNSQPWYCPGLTLEELVIAYGSELGAKNSKVEATILITILLNEEISIEQCLQCLQPLKRNCLTTQQLYKAVVIKLFHLTKNFSIERLIAQFEESNFVVKYAYYDRKTFLEIAKELKFTAS